MTTPEGEMERFFGRSPHCANPSVFNKIKSDLLDVAQALRLSLRIATWGETSQKKLCIYGGLPIAHLKTTYLIPMQIWVTSSYPVDPPTVYIIALDGEKIVANHKNVDSTGLCYCSNLASWAPQTSTPRNVVLHLSKIFSANVPIWKLEGGSEAVQAENASEQSKQTSAQASPNKSILPASSTGEAPECVVCLTENKDTVLVPCGHLCVCISCASNLNTCPMCRSAIQFRQRVFS